MLEDFGDELLITFRKPIDIGGLVTQSVLLTEPTGEQLQASLKETEPLGGLFKLIALTGNVSPAVAKRMGQRDLQRAASFFSHFDPENSLASSETSPLK